MNTAGQNGEGGSWFADSIILLTSWLNQNTRQGSSCLYSFKHAFRAGNKLLGMLVVQYSCFVSRLGSCLEINLSLVR